MTDVLPGIGLASKEPTPRTLKNGSPPVASADPRRRLIFDAGSALGGSLLAAAAPTVPGLYGMTFASLAPGENIFRAAIRRTAQAGSVSMAVLSRGGRRRRSELRTAEPVQNQVHARSQCNHGQSHDWLRIQARSNYLQR